MNKRVVSSLAIADLAFLHSSPGQAQALFYKGKTITILAGTRTGAVYDSPCPAVCPPHGQLHPGQSGHHRAKHARRGIDDRRKWEVNESSAKTARDFIEKVASISGTSGKPYLIRLKDGKEIPSREFLAAELQKIETAPTDRRASGG